MPVKGIDVSEHQGGVIDWEKVRASGVRFAFVKVNEGDRMDRKAHEHVRGAKLAGLIVGGYDFVRPKAGRTGAQEFDLFWRQCKALGLDRRDCLRPVIDVETTKLDAAATRRYVESWIAQCFAVTGKHPIIYTAGWFWEGVMKETRRKYGCRLWLAAYVRSWRSYIPAAWKRHASFWQYTDKGQVPGIAGDVDLNRYLSSLPNLKRSHTLGGGR